MPANWILFGILNYIIGVLFAFILLMSFRFTTEQILPSDDISEFMLLLISQFVIFFNSVFNIYVFHSLYKKIDIKKYSFYFYLIATSLAVISFFYILISTNIEYEKELKARPLDSSYILFIQIVLAFLAILMVVLIKQVILLISMKASRQVEE